MFAGFHHDVADRLVATSRVSVLAHGFACVRVVQNDALVIGHVYSDVDSGLFQLIDMRRKATPLKPVDMKDWLGPFLPPGGGSQDERRAETRSEEVSNSPEES